jgi:purine-binding chemotaxis protein CheW
VFNLGNEEYGLQIEYAQEILRIPDEVTKMPNMPSYFEGMINLRGKILPVIDLKKRFEYDQTGRNVDSRLLILDLEDILLGIIVDDVSEVVMIDDDAIEGFKFDIPGVSMNSIKGIAKIENRLIMLLDTSKIKGEIFEYSNQLEEDNR